MSLGTTASLTTDVVVSIMLVVSIVRVSFRPPAPSHSVFSPQPPSGQFFSSSFSLPFFFLSLPSFILTISLPLPSQVCILPCEVGYAADSGCLECELRDVCEAFNPCRNGGTCSNTRIRSGYNCSCPTSWRGTNCTECAVENCAQCSQTSMACRMCASGYNVDVSTGQCSE